MLVGEVDTVEAGGGKGVKKLAKEPVLSGNRRRVIQPRKRRPASVGWAIVALGRDPVRGRRLFVVVVRLRTRRPLASRSRLRSLLEAEGAELVEVVSELSVPIEMPHEAARLHQRIPLRVSGRIWLESSIKSPEEIEPGSAAWRFVRDCAKQFAQLGEQPRSRSAVPLRRTR